MTLTIEQLQCKCGTCEACLALEAMASNRSEPLAIDEAETLTPEELALAVKFGLYVEAEWGEVAGYHPGLNAPVVEWFHSEYASGREPMCFSILAQRAM